MTKALDKPEANTNASTRRDKPLIGGNAQKRAKPPQRRIASNTRNSLN